ncbi:hypothetical protein HJFPF1_05278 [Paramyrothecium foliicola]|nr:hypothetical protein HJFPF1_05278 [Paramyrothecium foliicola]
MVQTRAQVAAEQERKKRHRELPKATTRQHQPAGEQSKEHPIPSKRIDKRAIRRPPKSSPKPTSKQQQPPRSAAPETRDLDAANSVKIDNPIAFWVEKHRWPSQPIDPRMNRILARRCQPPSKRKTAGSSSSAVTSSDQMPNEKKVTPYEQSTYKLVLSTKGSFMRPELHGVPKAMVEACSVLLDSEQTFPRDSLFQDDRFENTRLSIRNKNEVRILRDITPLIVPSAEVLVIYGSSNLNCLVGSTNEKWKHSIPLVGPQPQPDYSLGFREEAFTNGQLAKLSPFIGDLGAGDLSFFMATPNMYFPFFACEVKCGTGSLDVAERQNAHSMTLAVRGVVELFLYVKREAEINQQILAFSVAHDNSTVKLCGHYAVIKGKDDIKYYCYPILDVALRARDKWAGYQFVKNIYDKWMPDHLKRIHSAIDQIPSDLVSRVHSVEESTALPQDPGSLAGLDESLLDGGAGSSHLDSQAASTLGPKPAKRRKRPVVESPQ